MLPYHFAAKYGYLPLVKYLTENGADVNAENINNDTPLFLLILAAEQEQQKQNRNRDRLADSCGLKQERTEIVEYMKSISKEST